MAETRNLIAELLSEAPEDTKKVILEVFKIEKDKVAQVNPYGVKDEIAAAIKDVVR
jgi:hypothetical protein